MTKKTTIIVKPNLEGYKEATDLIGNFLSAGSYVTVDIEPGERKKRSLSANALQHVWIGEIANFDGKGFEEVECELKRDIGLPILLSSGDETAIILGYMLEKTGYYDMTEERKLKVMKVTAVTRLMNKKQHTRYMDELQRIYAERGLILEVR